MRISKKTKTLITNVLIVLAIVAALVFVPALFSSDDTGYDKINVSYVVGGITATGDWDKDEECALYTKNAIECTGFKLTADFDSNIEYEVHYYDEHDKWISSVKSSELQLEVAAGDMPENATAIRIVIRPLDDEDNKIGFFETSKYAGQLTVQITTEEVESDATAE